MLNSQSPREKLIENFKIKCGSNYKKMYLSNMSSELLHLKLKYYVNSLMIQLENSNHHVELKMTIIDNNINLFNGITLLNTYSTEYVKNLKNESQLGMSLFIDWGYLLNYVEKSINKQLMIAL